MERREKERKERKKQPTPSLRSEGTHDHHRNRTQDLNYIAIPLLIVVGLYLKAAVSWLTVFLLVMRVSQQPPHDTDHMVGP